MSQKTNDHYHLFNDVNVELELAKWDCYDGENWDVMMNGIVIYTDEYEYAKDWFDVLVETFTHPFDEEV